MPDANGEDDDMLTTADVVSITRTPSSTILILAPRRNRTAELPVWPSRRLPPPRRSAVDAGVGRPRDPRQHVVKIRPNLKAVVRPGLPESECAVAAACVLSTESSNVP
jgi:hypothetical protein